MVDCNCDCHKKQNANDLHKCKEAGKKKDKRIKELEKKFLILIIAIAIVGTIIGKDIVDKILEFFETTERIQNVITMDQPQDYMIDYPIIYGGVSPSPNTLAVFGLLALTTKRRRCR
tara:strand:+ start:148 stop:498 length:351 start_codon:yes stop_codon:yes gene_type:complete